MDESEQNRSELPTPYKLQQARRKGAVARGVDLGFMTSLAALMVWMWFSGAGLEGQFAATARRTIAAAASGSNTPQGVAAIFAAAILDLARPITTMLATVFLAVLAFEFVQTGPIFSTEPLRFDFSRLDPAKGFKRLFSVRLLIETGKTLLKLVVYSAIAISVIAYALQSQVATIVDGATLRDAMARVGFRLLTCIVVAAVLFAFLDQIIVRRDFLKRMRMSRREVRRETRDREGDHRLKQKRKKLHAEFVKQSQSLRNIRGADVLITNPTHFAVALRYDVGRMAAPAVVAFGADGFARRLKRLAFLYGVVIVENRLLARALFQTARLDQQIPEPLFGPVADIYMSNRDLLKRKKLGPGHA